jgi:hypothetical protein
MLLFREQFSLQTKKFLFCEFLFGNPSVWPNSKTHGVRLKYVFKHARWRASEATKASSECLLILQASVEPSTEAFLFSEGMPAGCLNG